jgi:hypothetical protein
VLQAAMVAVGMAREASLLHARLQAGELDPARVLRRVFNALPRGWTACSTASD